MVSAELLLMDQRLPAGKRTEGKRPPGKWDQQGTGAAIAKGYRAAIKAAQEMIS